MTYTEIQVLAREFNRSSGVGGRKEVIRKIWMAAGKEGLLVLCALLKVDYTYLFTLGAIGELIKIRTASRRGRKRKTKHLSASEASMAAIEAACGGALASGGGRRSKTAGGKGNINNAAIQQSWQAIKRV